MIKSVFFIKRRHDISHEEFVDRHARHTQIGMELGILSDAVRYERRYLKSLGHPVEGPPPSQEFDCITEIWFRDRLSLDAALAKIAEPENASIIVADESRFIDRARTLAFIVEDEICTIG